MPDSALLPLANASLTFQVAGVGVVTDPTTGNVSPDVTNVGYTAFLKAVNVDPVVFPGVDAGGVVYEGYVVKPEKAVVAGVGDMLDSRVGVGTTGVLKFGSAAAVEFEVLRARLGYGDTGVLGAQLSALLGTKITLLAQLG